MHAAEARERENMNNSDSKKLKLDPADGAADDENPDSNVKVSNIWFICSNLRINSVVMN